MTDRLLDAEKSAEFCDIALPTLWVQVRTGRLPAPVYPAPRAPRWWESELREAIMLTRALPAEQAAKRRAGRDRVAAYVAAEPA
jgi:predicted DNA-binding transcriptional regulator AlpA